jgi:hypothetical protein
MTTCWRKQDGNIGNWTGLGLVPCAEPANNNDVVECCGTDSQCLGSGICYTPELNTDGGQSQFYMAGCSSETYADTDACKDMCSMSSVDEVSA